MSRGVVRVRTSAIASPMSSTAAATVSPMPLVTSIVFVSSSPVIVYRSSAVLSSSGSRISAARGTRSPVVSSASMSSHSIPTEDRGDVANGSVMSSF